LHALEIIEAVVRFIEQQGARSVETVDRIIGCPHEEGIDYPEGGNDSARHREAHLRESRCTREQPRREQPPADPKARAPDVRLSRSASHAGISSVLRPDSSALCAS
jgi:hypothetical protein